MQENRIKGFTLIELLFTLTLLALLTAFTLPAVHFLMRKNEQQLIYDEIKTIIQYAKLQSIRLGSPVYLSPLDAKMNWSQGIVLSYWDKKKRAEKQIHQWSGQHPHWLLTWSGIDSPRRITLSGNPGSAISNGQFTLTNADGGEKLVILLNRLGRVRSSN